MGVSTRSTMTRNGKPSRKLVKYSKNDDKDRSSSPSAHTKKKSQPEKMTNGDTKAHKKTTNVKNIQQMVKGEYKNTISSRAPCKQTSEKNSTKSKKQKSSISKSKTDEVHEVQKLIRLQNRVKSRLSNISLDEAMIEAYTAEGWKGARACWSKVGLSDSELKLAQGRIMKAKAQILQVLLDIESRIHRDIPGVPLIKDVDDPNHNAEDSDIELHDIKCAVCKSEEDAEDNDILLCDGVCGRAFHQKCHDPLISELPEDDEDWLCLFCQTKENVMGSINNFFNSSFSICTKPQDVLMEHVTRNAVVSPVQEIQRQQQQQQQRSLLEADLPSEDEEDDDYCTSTTSSEDDDDDEGEDVDVDKEIVSDDDDIFNECQDLNNDEFHKDPSPTISEKRGRRISISSPDRPSARRNGIVLSPENMRGFEFNMKEMPSPKILGKSIPRVTSKRKRSHVDYQALSMELFGSSIGIEVSDDEDYEPSP